ncbi:DUF2577 domain-containing protein [Psychrobacillus sp.]|uniref:DUF2577 domain-containing protein n=1 Tax=Psychrobacillus sp. TaxID=1871623 RepID=UPI0028BD97AE|nr:DUF2577 domain-containing protein [Psychrobacillus sp.]
MNMNDMIKQIAIKAVDAQNPVNVVQGIVKSVVPLEIEVHQKLKLTKEFLLLTERVTRYEVDLEHDHGGPKALQGKLIETPIRTGLATGDKVILLRSQGGGQFIVLDKVVE